MNLWNDAKAIAQEALQECEGDFDAAQEYIHQSCDMHEVVIYYHKAIRFCAEQDISAGEEFLEDCGGVYQPGDTFGAIACRIAFAILYCAAIEALAEMESEYEDS